MVPVPYRTGVVSLLRRLGGAALATMDATPLVKPHLMLSCVLSFFALQLLFVSTQGENPSDLHSRVKLSSVQRTLQNPYMDI